MGRTPPAVRRLVEGTDSRQVNQCTGDQWVVMGCCEGSRNGEEQVWAVSFSGGGRGPCNQGLEGGEGANRKIPTLMGPCQGDAAGRPKAQGQRI